VTKRILVGLIAALFFLLIGLIALLNFNKLPNKKDEAILSFIPPQTEFILRLRNSSKMANTFFSNPAVNDCFNFSELTTYWNQIDSLTSKNYKTADVLANNTSFICVDSLLNTLILVDINAKTNEHFIDQFIANSGASRKIERFDKGYKAFKTASGRPYYYFVKQSVFGISADEQFLINSMMGHPQTLMDIEIANWHIQTSHKISGWGKAGSSKVVLNQFDPENYILHNWIDSLASSFSFDIDLSDKMFKITGTLILDSLRQFPNLLGEREDVNQMYTINSDTSEFVNLYHSFSFKDSTGKAMPCNFVYYSFTDTSLANAQLLVTESPVSMHLFNTIKSDTSSQSIEMADDKIKQITVFNQDLLCRVLPVMPFNQANGKLFGTIFNGQLFITNSTEAMLRFAPDYPSNYFVKRKLEKGCIIAYRGLVIRNRRYSVSVDFNLGTQLNTIKFESELMLLPNN
jgi:hypothetical protein